MQEANPDDPLNHEAAKILMTNPNQFREDLDETMRGGVLNGVRFDHVITE